MHSAGDDTQGACAGVTVLPVPLPPDMPQHHRIVPRLPLTRPGTEPGTHRVASQQDLVQLELLVEEAAD